MTYFALNKSNEETQERSTAVLIVGKFEAYVYCPVFQNFPHLSIATVAFQLPICLLRFVVNSEMEEADACCLVN